MPERPPGVPLAMGGTGECEGEQESLSWSIKCVKNPQVHASARRKGKTLVSLKGVREPTRFENW